MSIAAVNSLQNYSAKPNFSQKMPEIQPNQKVDTNPISRKGETANLVKATFLGGLALAARLFWEVVINGEFGFDIVADKADNLVEKNKKHLTDNKKLLCKAGAFVALTAACLAGFAIIYTAFNAPKIAYKSKVNTFKKSKEMDTYTKSNNAERELYEQIADKAKNATLEEKEALKEQYLKMKMAKNQVPDFVKQKQK